MSLTRERRKARQHVAALLLLSLATPVTVAGCSAFTSSADTPREKPRYQRNGVGPSSQLPARTGGDWDAGKRGLRDPSTCVVTINGLQEQLVKIQSCFCSDEALADVDLRTKVRCDNEDETRHDCEEIYNAVMASVYTRNESEKEKCQHLAPQLHHSTEVTLALAELARGVASLADGKLAKTCTGVHMRVVCASDYRAIDPPFHTDKCPFRGYVTLAGQGTQYMDETCLPHEYAALRTLGVDGLQSVSGQRKVDSLKSAKGLEFIVMKGDTYDAPPSEDYSPSASDKLLNRFWTRSAACVHRSPPSHDGGGDRRRVILSLDLADGVDDQEWHEARRKRSWRSGMTQRKSHLVS